MFSPVVESSIRLDLYCRILRCVCDERDGVALEAMCCLMEHQNAWQLLIDFQNQLQSIYILECVVNRLHKCLQGGLIPRVKGTENQSSMAVLQAACRVCCIVGQTLQRAVSFELINFNLNGSGNVSSSIRVFTSEPFFASPRNDSASVIDGDRSHSHSRTPTPPFVAEDLLVSPFLPHTPPIREQDVKVDKTSPWRRHSVALNNIAAIEVLYSILWDECLLNSQNRLFLLHFLYMSPFFRCLHTDCDAHIFHRHILCLALQAIFLTIPDPNPADTASIEIWSKIRLKACVCLCCVHAHPHCMQVSG